MLSASLHTAGIESPLFRKRGIFMSQPTFWLERMSFERSIGGVARLPKRVMSRKQRRK